MLWLPPTTLISVLLFSATPAPQTSSIPPISAPDSGGAPRLTVELDARHQQVLLAIGPFHIATVDPMMDNMPMGMVMPGMEAFEQTFPWPVDGHARGYTMTITNGDGQPLSRHLIHHLVLINDDRRELLMPAAERVMAVGQETSDLMLPSTIGLPLSRGLRMKLRLMWHNDSGAELDGVMLRLSIHYSPSTLMPAPVSVLPIMMDAFHRPGRPNGFDIPPGHFERAREFVMPIDGRLMGVSGHLHAYGSELRLVDAVSGKVLTRIVTTRDSLGRITRMPTRLFGVSGEGLSVRAGHHYKIVTVYENTSPDTLWAAMGYLVGLIRPRDLTRWPARGDKESAYLDLRETSANEAPAHEHQQ